MTIPFPSLACAAALALNVRAMADDAVPAAPPDPAGPLIEQAMNKLQDGDVEGAAPLIDQAIRANPRNVVAHVLRGDVEASKAQWSQARAEFAQAQQLAPNDTEIKMMLAGATFGQKDYAAARALYVPLQATTDDFATYSIYLCDLLSGHDELAAKELAAFREGASPAYYFAHGAERLYRHDVPGGKASMEMALRLFPNQENDKYAEPLRTAGYLPLPLIQ